MLWSRSPSGGHLDCIRRISEEALGIRTVSPMRDLLEPRSLQAARALHLGGSLRLGAVGHPGGSGRANDLAKLELVQRHAGRFHTFRRRSSTGLFLGLEHFDRDPV